ncbi:hypothetical protein BBJ28_00017749 [Nothophytophthora sp. Chile5]|nr:hypothetical protein BBJ28_00017749 [Nothophytophthora sp. Chile5]
MWVSYCLLQMEICDQNVETASEWLLENDWQELTEDQELAGEQAIADTAADTGVAAATAIATTVATQPRPTPLARRDGYEPAPAPPRPDDSHFVARFSGGGRGDPTPATATAADLRLRTMVVSTEVNLPDPNGQRDNPRPFYARRTVAPGYDSAGERESDEEAEEEEEEEEEEDDEDDEDDEDEEGNRYYDSEDDTLFQGGLPPLAKRTKITKPRAEAGETTRGADEFWVAFDDLVVPKTMIGRLILELLNTTLSKLAHSKVTLLNQPAKEIDEVGDAIAI